MPSPGCATRPAYTTYARLMPMAASSRQPMSTGHCSPRSCAMTSAPPNVLCDGTLNTSVRTGRSQSSSAAEQPGDQDAETLVGEAGCGEQGTAQDGSGDDRHGPGLGVEVPGREPLLPGPVAGLLRPAERGVEIHPRGRGVDPDHPGVERIAQPQRAAQVLGEQRGDQPVPDAVGDLNGLLRAAGPQQRRHRGEDLLGGQWPFRSV